MTNLVIIKENRYLLIACIVFLILAVCLPIYIDNRVKTADRLLLDVPITISPPGYVDTMINIPLRAPYDIRLQFFNVNNADYDKFAKLSGGPFGALKEGGKKGIPIPVRWAVYSIPEQECLLKGELTSVGVQEFPSTMYFARLIGSIQFKDNEFLEPGQYRFIAQVLRDVPEGVGIPIRMRITMNAPYGYKHFYGEYIVLSILKVLVWIVEFILLFTLALKIAKRMLRKS